jgi:hypothetical protein
MKSNNPNPVNQKYFLDRSQITIAKGGSLKILPLEGAGWIYTDSLP